MHELAENGHCTTLNVLLLRLQQCPRSRRIACQKDSQMLKANCSSREPPVQSAISGRACSIRVDLNCDCTRAELACIHIEGFPTEKRTFAPAKEICALQSGLSPLICLFQLVSGDELSRSPATGLQHHSKVRALVAPKINKAPDYDLIMRRKTILCTVRTVTISGDWSPRSRARPTPSAKTCRFVRPQSYPQSSGYHP